MTTRLVMSLPEPETCVSLVCRVSVCERVCVKEIRKKKKRRRVFITQSSAVLFLKPRGMLALEFIHECLIHLSFIVFSVCECVSGSVN